MNRNVEPHRPEGSGGADGSDFVQPYMPLEELRQRCGGRFTPPGQGPVSPVPAPTREQMERIVDDTNAEPHRESGGVGGSIECPKCGHMHFEGTRCWTCATDKHRNAGGQAHDD